MATRISDITNGPAKDGLLKNVYLDKKNKVNRKPKPHARPRRTNKR